MLSLEKLLEKIDFLEKKIKENEKQENGKAKIYSAFIKAQGQFQKVSKNKENPFFKSRYLTLDGLIEIIRKPFASNGLGFSQRPAVIEKNGKIYVEITTYIYHESGEELPPHVFTLPMSTTKVNEQTIGSVVTYAKRYALQSLVGICADDDDDCNEAVKASEQTVKAPQQYHCCKCNKVIEQRLAQYSKQQLGAYYCGDCGKAEKQSREQQTEEAKEDGGQKALL